MVNLRNGDSEAEGLGHTTVMQLSSSAFRLLNC